METVVLFAAAIAQQFHDAVQSYINTRLVSLTLRELLVLFFMGLITVVLFSADGSKQVNDTVRSYIILRLVSLRDMLAVVLVAALIISLVVGKMMNISNNNITDDDDNDDDHSSHSSLVSHRLVLPLRELLLVLFMGLIALVLFSSDNVAKQVDHAVRSYIIHSLVSLPEMLVVVVVPLVAAALTIYLVVGMMNIRNNNITDDDNDNDDDDSSGSLLVSHYLYGFVVTVLATVIVIVHFTLRQQGIDLDEETDQKLFQAARDGNEKECRVLFQRLSARAKKKYSDPFKNDDWYQIQSSSMTKNYYPLHEAVRNGHYSIVQLLVQELHFNVNQYDKFRNTPLFYAASSNSRNEGMSRFLLEHGADVNRGGRYGPLYEAVSHGNTNVVMLLLQHGADPNLHRKSAAEEAFNFELNDTPRCTDKAINHGHLQILTMLLAHGAYVGHFHATRTTTTVGGGTALNRLLLNGQKSLKTKLDICQLLVQWANNDNSNSSNSIEQTRATVTAVTMLLQHSLEMSIQAHHQTSCTILIKAGVNASLAIYGAIQEENMIACQLLLESGVDPFLHDDDNGSSSRSELMMTTKLSPFQAAARLQDTAILQLFLQHWNERFFASSSSNGDDDDDDGGGRNNDGMYPIHVLACYKHVSLQAIQLVIEGQEQQDQAANAHNNNALMAVDEKHGLYPFHFAALSDVKLDVLYCILKHYPDALAAH